MACVAARSAFFPVPTSPLYLQESFLSAGGTPTLHFVLQSALSGPGSGARLMETNLHTQPPAAFSCLPGTRRVTVGVWTGPQKPSSGDKVVLTSGGQWAVGGDAGERSAAVSSRVDGGAVSKDRRLHLASWLAQQFLQEV